MSATLEKFTGGVTGEDDGEERVVVAVCLGCGSVHPVESRQADEETTASTVCPGCGSPSYTTEVHDRRVVDKRRAREKARPHKVDHSAEIGDDLRFFRTYPDPDRDEEVVTT